ncbi:hypothetical protein ORV05_04790 [Amycolatopsis cynarae]|uniref:Uncharacterized protein n=1 Tax=Amycolatopsis cynarae TaxID=2995223 RepID=A0ABY7B7E4_9PSEU|nr:hypothetical protein [Amycolatopsis sp. HUAS 11-8]WAL67108.1 hypothetical protein ORV05_04790 [Amycolatopsis sp. HUAS 11-8]
MNRLLVVGVDPGVTTGICALPYLDGRLQIEQVAVIQANPAAVPRIVAAFLAEAEGFTLMPILAVEEFVTNLRAARSATPEAGRITRQLIAQLQDVHLDHAARWYRRPAGIVKPWATDARIEAAGLDGPTHAMRNHARDAARHALYAAVRDGGIPDPLSRKAQP